MHPLPRCNECGGECLADLPVYVVEIVEPHNSSKVGQLCSPKCVAAWLAAYKARRDGITFT